MATIGVRDLFVAKCTVEAGVLAETYGTPRRLAKAIKIEMTTSLAEATLYADDGIDEIAKEFASGEIKINTNDITDADEAELLGQKQDANNVAFGNGDDNAPYWAVGFSAKKANGQFIYVWLYKVKFGVPDETYDTKADGIAFNTPTITGVFIKREKDGNYRAKVTALPTDSVAAAWFQSVYEPVDEADAG
jgi:phi13 family phage major tail protein